MNQTAAQLMESFRKDDTDAIARLLSAHPEFCGRLNEGVFPWNMPPLAAAKSREMVDVLIKFGASIDHVSQWWAAGFGVHQVNPDTAKYLVEQGAELTIHAATGIGLIDEVREMLLRDPSMSTAKGGDGCHPLHFCTEPRIAMLLMERGADLDARDDDHSSTPAQWRVGDSPEFVRFLLDHGASADVFMAAALGDLELANRLVYEQPECTSYRIGNNKGPYPGIGFQKRGGTIYQWSLGFNLSPHEVALKRGHTTVYEFLWENTPPQAKLLVACTSANRPLAESIIADHPQLVQELDAEYLALLAKFCWETNKNIDAVRLMLDVGFPVDAPEFNHGYTPLHNAAWCGDPELVDLLIEHKHPTDLRDPENQSTPIGWAIYSCIEAKRHPEGRFAEVVERLLNAGTPFPPESYPVGHAEIDRVLKQYLDAQV